MSVSFFLGTICGGGHFVIPGKGDSPSLDYMNAVGVTHCYMDEMCLMEMDVASMLSTNCLKRCTSRAKMRTLYVAAPSKKLVEEATGTGLRVQSVYNTTPVFGCILGQPQVRKVDSKKIWKGIIAKPDDDADSMMLVSQGTPQCGMEVAVLPLSEGG